MLYPKPAGFSVCVDQLLLPADRDRDRDRDSPGLGQGQAAGGGLIIHDITIAYRDFRPGKRTVEASIVQGNIDYS